MPRPKKSLTSSAKHAERGIALEVEQCPPVLGARPSHQGTRTWRAFSRATIGGSLMPPRRPSHPSRVTGVRSRFCMTAAMVGALLALGVPADAVAEISKGSASDPAGDSEGAPSQDFVSATAQYDSNGSLTVTATMNGNIAQRPESLFSFG